MGLYDARTFTTSLDLNAVQTVHFLPGAFLDAKGTDGTNQGGQVYVAGGKIHTMHITTDAGLAADQLIQVYDYRDAAGKPLQETNTRVPFKLDLSGFTNSAIQGGVLSTVGTAAAFTAGRLKWQKALKASADYELTDLGIECEAGIVITMNNGSGLAGAASIFSIAVTWTPKNTGQGRYRDRIQNGISFARRQVDKTILPATVPDAITSGADPTLTFNGGHKLPIESQAFQITTSGITDIADGTYTSSILNETEIQIFGVTSGGTTVGGGTAAGVLPAGAAILSGGAYPFMA